MNETDRGPRDHEDDHSQTTDERDEPTYEEREEWIAERGLGEIEGMNAMLKRIDEILGRMK